MTQFQHWVYSFLLRRMTSRLSACSRQQKAARLGREP